MSYMRDPDRATRGVRAIASADNSPRRHALQLRRMQATRARDRAMASVARGALGLVAMDPGAAGAGVAPSGTYKIGFTPGATYTSFTTSTNITPQPPPAYTVSGLSPPPHPQPTDPGALLPPSTPTPPSSSTDAGGGGGVGVAMGPAPASPPIPPIPTLDTGEPPVTAPASDNTMRNVLIAGGAAVAVYLLFFRKRSS